MSVESHLKTFADHTSMHGARNSVLVANPFRRRLWLFLLLCAWIMFIIQMSFVCKRFAERPKKITVDIVQDGVPFPAVTLCNMRHLSLDTMQLLNDVVEAYAVYNKSADKIISLVSNSSSASTEFVLSQLKFFRFIYDVEVSQDSDFVSRSRELSSPRILAANIAEEILRKGANRRSNYIVWCKYQQKLCNINSDFSEHFNDLFYTCFTYTPPGVKSGSDNKFSTIEEDQKRGWSTVVLSGSGILKDTEVVTNGTLLGGIFDTESTVTGGEGVRVIIHPPNTTPMPTTEGFDVPPGYSASFEIRPKLTERIDEPYGQCTETNPFDGALVGERYRKNECVAMCIQRFVMDRCECVDSSLPRLKDMSIHSPQRSAYCGASSEQGQQDGSSDDTRSSTSTSQFCRYLRFEESLQNEPCTVQNETYNLILNSFYNKTKCSDEVAEEVYRNSSLLASCRCFAPCREFSYDVSYSISKWPSLKSEAPDVVREIKEKMNFFSRLNESCSGKEFERYNKYLHENVSSALKDFVRINVFAADSSVLKTVESPDYQTFQLISDIGGQLGIWIGVSVLTISEAFEMLLFIFWDIVRPLRKSKTAKTDVEKQSNS